MVPIAATTAPAVGPPKIVAAMIGAAATPALAVELVHDQGSEFVIYYDEAAPSSVAMAASELLKVEINGMGVHGSTPWMGKDPMTVAAEIILALGQIYRQVPATEAITISIGKVDDKGRFNVIGDNITLWGTVRCIHQQLMEDVNMRIQRIVTNVAAAHGLTAADVADQLRAAYQDVSAGKVDVGNEAL